MQPVGSLVDARIPLTQHARTPREMPCEKRQGCGRTATKLPPGFLRPPFSGTFTTVPSSIFSSACCTPSPAARRPPSLACTVPQCKLSEACSTVKTAVAKAGPRLTRTKMALCPRHAKAKQAIGLQKGRASASFSKRQAGELADENAPETSRVMEAPSERVILSTSSM